MVFYLKRWVFLNKWEGVVDWSFVIERNGWKIVGYEVVFY